MEIDPLDTTENARAEFINHINDRVVQCAQISYEVPEDKIRKVCVLKCDYTPAEYKAFLQSIDFKYDAGYGWQELYGYIWYVDGTWSERYEYDGKECWVHKKRREIPNELQR